MIGLFTADIAQGQGNLVIVDPTISGDTVTLPIHLQGNVLDGVAALDFQLSYDSAILQPVQVQLGEAAANAGKELQARLLADGQYVVLMFGLGRNAVAQGEVARISLDKLSDPKDGQTPVTIVNTKLATISGVEIPSQGSATTLLFDDEGGRGSGDAGGLPPIFNGGLPTGTTNAGQIPAAQNTETADIGSIPTATGPSGRAAVFDLEKARVESEARLSMLRGAQEEREAARAAVERVPTAGGSDAGMRVRRAPSSPSAIAENRPDSRRDSSDTSGTSPVARSDSGELAENTSPRAAAQSIEEGSKPSVKTVPIERSPGNGPLALDDIYANPPIGKGLWVRAGFVAACLTISFGIFLIRRKSGA